MDQINPAEQAAEQVPEQAPEQAPVDAKQHAVDMKRRSVAPRTVLAGEVTMGKNDVRILPVLVTTKGFRIAKFQNGRGPLHLQLNGGGWFSSKFGIKVQEVTGKTVATFSVNKLSEHVEVAALGDSIVAEVFKRRSEFFPKVNDLASENEVKRLLDSTFIGERRPKEEKDKRHGEEGGDTWPGNIKANVPLNDMGRLVDCRVLDSEGKDFPFCNLPGQRWQTIVVEIGGLYLKGKGWGIGPKNLRFVQLAPPKDAATKPETYNFEEYTMTDFMRTAPEPTPPVNRKRAREEDE